MGSVLPGVSAKMPFSPVVLHNDAILQNGRVFFVDAPGGTGKTFVVRAIHALLQARERNVLPVASSAVASSLLGGGRTAHSTFKIPIPCYADSVCNISADSSLAVKLRSVDLIIWDEVVMCHRFCIEAVDRTLRDIMDIDVPFGNKCVLFSGDFRQILPIISGGSRAETVHACLKSSALFPLITQLKLGQNMRLVSLRRDPNADSSALEFPEYLLKVGEGRLQPDSEVMIELPSSVNMEQDAASLALSVFEGIEDNYADAEWVTSRAILATKNARLDLLNGIIGSKIPGNYKTLISADSATSDNTEIQAGMELQYTQELLNSLTAGSSMPDHCIRLKKGFIVMLLRNLRPAQGHVNGTRYVVENFTNNLLFLRAVSGAHRGSRIVIPRMNCTPNDDDFPIPGFRRCQFPVRVCFAMTVNKSQGQSISGKLGLDLSSPVFSHGQLYVALSRTTHPKNVYICTFDKQRKTRNVVYTEVLSC